MSEADQGSRRAECELNHAEFRVPHSGFGWLGWRCTKCGYMFFDVWDDWAAESLHKKGQQGST